MLEIPTELKHILFKTKKENKKPREVCTKIQKKTVDVHCKITNKMSFDEAENHFF